MTSRRLVLSLVSVASLAASPSAWAQPAYRLRDIHPAGSSYTGGGIGFGNAFLFAADDGVNGVELWRTDGTEAGTVLVKDIAPGASSSSPGAFALRGGLVLFAASDGVNGVELWRSDGTEAGTMLVKDIVPGAGSSNPQELVSVELEGIVYFSASGDLWRSDGTTPGTLLVQQFATSIRNLTRVDRSVYYTLDCAPPTSGTCALWYSGPFGGTFEVFAGNAHDLAAVERKYRVFFGAGVSLWAADDDATELRRFDFGIGPEATLLVDVAGQLFFAVKSFLGEGYNYSLWTSDGDGSLGTRRVSQEDLRGINGGNVWVREMKPLGTRLLYATSPPDQLVSTELSLSDGASVTLVRAFSSVAELTPVGEWALFRADDGVAGAELWRSDGTPGGTVRLQDLAPGGSSSNPSGFVAGPAGVLFSAGDGAGGREPWFLPAGAMPVPRPQILILDTSINEAIKDFVGFSFATINPTQTTVTVPYTTVDGLARSSADYVARSGLLTLPPGAWRQTLLVSMLTDPIYDPGESFFVDLTVPAGVNVVRGRAECVIVEDDLPPAVATSPVEPSVTEGNAGNTSVSVDVSLSGQWERPIVLDYATSSQAFDAATAGADYVASSGALTFASGAGAQTIVLTVAGDAEPEPAEFFLVDFTRRGESAVARTMRVNIVEDEAPGLYVLDTGVREPSRGWFDARFRVVQVGGSSPVTVQYATRDGTAAAGADYTTKSGSFGLQTLANVTVPVLGDLARERAETFFLDITSPGGPPVRRGSGRALIADSRTADDTTGEGEADIIWRHAQGALFIWAMHGTGLAGASYLDPISLDWEVQGTADFNGDGKSDVLWRERTTGSTFIWMMDGAHLIGGTGYTTLFADATWSVQALADFNGDGRGDLLWRAADGALYVWVSKEPHPQYGLDYDGRAFTGAYLDTIGTDWQVAAVGDMNGDGNSDILWRQVGTGATYVWMMNGGQVVAGTGPTAAQADERWVVEGLGDFDGDGKSDILWRNVGGPDTGAMYVWLMNGTQLWGSTYLDPISTDWQVEGLADFNGDAKTDVLWRNRNAAAGDAGFLYIWMMDGPTVIAGTGYTAAQADFSWQVQTPR